MAQNFQESQENDIEKFKSSTGPQFKTVNQKRSLSSIYSTLPAEIMKPNPLSPSSLINSHNINKSDLNATITEIPKKQPLMTETTSSHPYQNVATNLKK